MTENPYVVMNKCDCGIEFGSQMKRVWNEGYNAAIEDALRVSRGYQTVRDLKALKKVNE